VSVSNDHSDQKQTNSDACAKPDELVFKVVDATPLIEQSPLYLRPSKLARVLISNNGFTINLEKVMVKPVKHRIC